MEALSLLRKTFPELKELIPYLRLHLFALWVRGVIAAIGIAVAVGLGGSDGLVQVALGGLVGWFAWHSRVRTPSFGSPETLRSMDGFTVEPVTLTVRRACTDQPFLFIVALPLTLLGVLDVVAVFSGVELGMALRSARVVVRTRAEQRRRGATRFRIDEDTRIYARKKNSTYVWVAGYIGYRETHIRSAAL